MTPQTLARLIESLQTEVARVEHDLTKHREAIQRLQARRDFWYHQAAKFVAEAQARPKDGKA